MKKKIFFEIPDKKRKIYIIVSIISAAVFVLALLLFGVIGVPVERTIVKATCSTVSEISYDLVFRDDQFYNETELSFGDGYVTKYVDAIDMDFDYDFQCGGATDINGTYDVTALLEANYNSTYLIWEKEYPLISERTFSADQLSGSFYLPLSDYIETAEEIEMSTGVSTSAIMTVTYHVDVSALVDGKLITDTSVSTLTFDLSENVLVMGGTPRQEQTSNAEETIVQDIIPRRTALYISVPPAFLSLCAILFLLCYTLGVPEDPVKLQLCKLYKKYGNRIAELYPGTAICKHETIMVSSFKDLLLTADELKRPIFKKYSDNYADVEFYVIDEIELYIFSPKPQLK
ncbi:MAG: hypothetical protein EOM54_06640 [Clostridia bacterium]|nr:hypothetical protein [Clostridia bacterium]NCC68762.1 hypothetical protein [Clostridia bacterium]